MSADPKASAQTEFFEQTCRHTRDPDYNVTAAIFNPRATVSHSTPDGNAPTDKRIPIS
jgi:hypothetical protein